MSRPRKCVVCGAEPAADWELAGVRTEVCEACFRHWFESVDDDAIAWAARRARWAMRRVAKVEALARGGRKGGGRG